MDILDSARSILRDWRVGKFPCYTLPPKSSTRPTPVPTPSEDVALVDYEAADHAVAPLLRSRKELRTAGGLIRLSPGSIDERTMQLDGPALPTTAALDGIDLRDLNASGESDEEGDGEDDVNEGSDENEGSEEEEEDWEGEDEVPPQHFAAKRKRAHEASISTSKRKRTILDTLSSRPQLSAPTRKVSFAATAKGNKGLNAKYASASKAAGFKAKPSKSAEKHTVGLGAKRASNASSNKQAKSSDGASGEAYDFKQFF